MDNEISRILICDCNSSEHQIIFNYDSEDNIVYCNIHLVKKGFLKRLLIGIKYIFGHKSRFGEWDEFILKPEHSKELKRLYKLLNKK